jgi:catechol 2,3-dioxygenase-like lactoylglutathione lyase family enzyme
VIDGMSLKINHITFDAHDPATVAGFWGEAMGWSENPDHPNLPGDDECALFSPDGSPILLFIRVPEGKSVKNRVHLDVAPTDSTRDVEVERLIGLGSTIYDDRRTADGRGWVVLQDPEGNELCVERAAGESAS